MSFSTTSDPGNPLLRKKTCGKSREGRDELASIMEFIRAGDELVALKLEARSLDA